MIDFMSVKQCTISLQEYIFLICLIAKEKNKFFQFKQTHKKQLYCRKKLKKNCCRSQKVSKKAKKKRKILKQTHKSSLEL